MKDNWLKDLQGKLADYEREAPDMLWENIEKQLQSPRHKRNAHVWTWRKYVAAAILLLLICSSYFLISQTDIDMSVDNRLANIDTSNIDIKKHSKPVATHEENKGVVKLEGVQKLLADENLILSAVITDHEDDLPLLQFNRHGENILVYPKQSTVEKLDENSVEYSLFLGKFEPA